MAVVGFNVKASAQLEKDGSVVARGNKLFGGDSSSVDAQLTGGVQLILST